ncbi:MAG: PAS domain S-box protein [Euryarchaeota archaeon]|nr:PAS domain S-box protein [Euryarchaeota archaeon]
MDITGVWFMTTDEYQPGNTRHLNCINILCVDDEPALLELCKLYLERDGHYNVDTAISALSALDLLKKNQYQAIISDYQMPEMDGIEFLKTVRGSGSDIPFIIFTGKGREDVVIEALNEGADYYLQKGGKPKPQYTELAHKVNLAIQKRQAETEIRDLERRESNILNFLPDATLAIDRSGHVIAWNKAIEEMTGVSAAEMLGKGDYEYALPFYGIRRPILIDLIFESADIIAKKYKNVIHDRGVVLIADTTLPQPRGHKLTLMGKASPLYNPQGEVVGAIESIRDITYRKRAEEELQAAYEQLTAHEEELHRQYDELALSERRIRESECRLKYMLGFYEKIQEPGQALLNYAVEGTRIVTGSPLGYLAFLNDDESELTMYAWSQTAMEEYSLQKKPIIFRTENTGLWGEAVRQRRPVITNDYAAPNPKKKGYPKGHPEIVRHMNIPVMDGSHIVIIAGVANKPTDYTDEDVRELSIMMQELWLVLKRRRAEEALQESEEHLRTTLHSIGDAVITTDTEGAITRMNPVAADLTGWAVEEAKGKPLTEVFHIVNAITKEHAANPVKKMLEKGENVGLANHTMLIAKDAREYQIADSAAPIRDSEGNIKGVVLVFRDVTEDYAVRKALCESEERYRTVFENTGTATVVIEENTIISLANAGFESLTCFSKEEIEGKMSWTDFVVREDLKRMGLQHTLRRKDREAALRHYEFRAVTRSGEMRNIYLSIDVIPGTKKSVASLLDITDRKRWEEALTMANRKLNLINSITRHDINNQLTVLRGCLEILEDDQPDLSHKEYFQRVTTAAEQISSMIQFTKTYEEISVAASAWQDARRLVETAAKEMTPESQVQIINDLPHGTEVFACPMLEKVFCNLIDNAIRHGGKVTTVRFSSEDRAGDLIILCEDDGVGIPLAEKEKIFERGVGKNTGLGLFLTREILSITGITITETGEPGNGARFEIVVPDGAYRTA